MVTINDMRNAGYMFDEMSDGWYWRALDETDIHGPFATLDAAVADCADNA